MPDELKQRIQSKGFTPGRRDVAPLVDLLVSATDEGLERLCEDALRRADSARVLHVSSEAYDRAVDATRHRLIRLVGKLQEPERVPLLVRAAAAPAGRVRREAIRALGRTTHDDARATLLALAERADLDPSERRALAEALGKVGGREAETYLASLPEDDALTAKVRAKARVTLDRTLARDQTRSIRTEVAVRARLRFSCRGGVERLLGAALVEAGFTEVKTRALGTVEAFLDGPLELAYRVRLWTDFGFVLEAPSGTSEIERIERAVLDPACIALVQSVSDGTPTFRVAFASGTKKRSLVWEIAQRVNDRGLLRNDPHESLWTLHVDDVDPRAPLLLAPTHAADSRFSYRVADVPAASHPTLAAALVRVGVVRPSDIVWDPFCGSGLELIERARLGPFREAFGSDIDRNAIDMARKNVASAGITNVTLSIGDALHGPPRAISLIVTNPPLGRRVAREKGLAEMLEQFVEVAAEALGRKGRFVWFSPFPERTRRAAIRAGLDVQFATTVDMGGFPCELQRFDKA